MSSAPPRDGTAVAVGDSGTLIARDSDGSWSTQAGPTANHLHAVSISDAGTFAVGDHGIVLRQDGDSWLKEAEAPGEFMYGVYGKDTDVVAVGWAGRAIRRRSDATWVNEISGTVNVLEAVTAGPDGAFWALGHKGTVLERP